MKVATSSVMVTSIKGHIQMVSRKVLGCTGGKMATSILGSSSKVRSMVEDSGVTQTAITSMVNIIKI